MALALQLVMSFGHHHDHGHDVYLEDATHTAIAGEGSRCLPDSVAPCSPSDRDDDEDHCSICWTITLAGTALLPVLAIITPPALEGLPLEPAKVVALRVRAWTAAFQARAPPCGPIA